MVVADQNSGFLNHWLLRIRQLNRKFRTNCRSVYDRPTVSRTQLDPKTAAAAKFGFDANPPAHQLYSFADGRQTQTNSWKILFRIDPCERQKYPLLVFLRYADAVVIDHNPAKIFFHGCGNGDLRLHSRRHKLDRIREQIGQRDFEQRRISLDGAGFAYDLDRSMPVSD